MALHILSSLLHNIKRFKETEVISVRKRQGRRPLLDARFFVLSVDTASLVGMIVSMALLNELLKEILPESTVGKHNPPCHLQMPTKARSCRKP